MTENFWRADITGLWNGRTLNKVRSDEIRAERMVQLAASKKWREDAIADGWSSEPTYEHESEGQAFRLKRDGFLVMGLCRLNKPDLLPVASIHIWGPDDLAIKAAEKYSWDEIQRGVSTCGYCGAHPVETARVAFAGRACPTCLPIQTAALPHNWSD